jgi:toxin ParE1/3/4
VAGPSVRLHPDAIAEARAAYEWYAERNPSAANAFISELDHAISRIQTSPERWTMHLHGTRKFLLRRFPYWLLEAAAVSKQISPCQEFVRLS